MFSIGLKTWLIAAVLGGAAYFFPQSAPKSIWWFYLLASAMGLGAYLMACELVLSLFKRRCDDDR